MLVVLGIIGISTGDQGKSLTQKAVKYANETTAQNAAHTAIQIAMQKINEDEDDSWVKAHDSKDNAWEHTIDEATVELYVETNSDYSTNDYWEEDSLRITSRATYADGYESEVVSVYLKEPFGNLVPTFKSALQLATNDFTIESITGSASINGMANDTSCSNMPGVAVLNDTDKKKVEDKMGGNAKITGNPAIGIDEDLTYEPVDEMIARLKKSGNAKFISGNYKGSMGTADNPGVFFVNEYVKLSGGLDEGYGILVVQGGGEMDYEGELDVKGNFTFNGLVIFENAEKLDGGGTPTVNGSVLIGKRPSEESTTTEDYTTIDIKGNMGLQYDCLAEIYARMAAANAVQQNKYTRVVTYE